MSNAKHTIIECMAFTERHLAELAREFVDWGVADTLRDGKLKELARMLGGDDREHLVQATTFVSSCAIMEAAKKHTS